MNLYVGNLNPETTENDLMKAFSEFGEIVSIKVIRDMETGMPKGFGFVEMADKYQAFDAIDNIDATYFQGNIISVKEAKPKAGPGGPRKPGGFGPRKPFNNNRGFNSDRNRGFNSDR